MGSLIRLLAKRSAFVRSLVGLVLSLSGAQASAEMVNCPGPEVFEALAGTPSFDVASAEVLGKDLEARCANSSDYLWLRGLVARRIGDLDAASIWFEASMLREPGRAGVLLDFALTREALGDFFSAQLIYQGLLRDHEPSPKIRSLIVARLKVVEAKLANREAKEATPSARTSPVSVAGSAGWTGLLGVSMGYDSNLNSASSLRAFNFVIEDQAISLEIPERDLPQPGHFQSINSRLEQRFVSNEGHWGATLRQSYRQPEITRFRTAAIEMTLDGAHKLQALGPLSGEVAFLLAKQWLGVDDALVARADRISIAYEPMRRISLRQGECSAQMGMEFEQRRYPARQVLDGDVLYKGLKLLCDGNNTRVEIFGRGGTDQRVDPNRAGGDQLKVDWGAALIHKLSNQTVRLHWFVSNSNDKIGYNSLIENNIIRKSRRTSAGLEWSFKPFILGLEPFVSYERTNQSASISLFAFSAWQISSGLRWRF